MSEKSSENMDNMDNVVNVFISGDKDAFLSKGSVLRFKNDVRTGVLKDSSDYLKKGWVYKISSREKNKVDVNLVLDMFDINSRKHERLHEKLKQLKYKRMSRNNDNVYVKQNVPSHIYDAYSKARDKMPMVQFMNPVDVIKNPSRYTTDIKTIVDTTTHLNNEYTAYYRALHSHQLNE